MCVCACNIHIHIYLHRRMEIRNPSTTPGWSHVIYDYGKNEGVGVACTNVIDNNHIVDAAKINQELHPAIPKPRCCLWNGRPRPMLQLKTVQTGNVEEHHGVCSIDCQYKGWCAYGQCRHVRCDIVY